MNDEIDTTKPLATFIAYEEDAVLRYSKARALCSLLWEFDQYLREEIKYKDNDSLEPVREKLYQMMEEEGINLDELWR